MSATSQKNNKHPDLSKSIKEFDKSYVGGHTDNDLRQARLAKLVKKYGVDNVALAGGYTVSSLVQYLRVNPAVPISENKVLKAERWAKFYEGK